MADPQRQPARAEQQQQQASPSVIAGVAAVLAAGRPIAVSSAAIGRLTAAPPALVAAILTATVGQRRWPGPPPRDPTRLAHAQAILDERYYCAAYLVNAVRRVQARLASEPPHVKVLVLSEALRDERRFWQQHRAATEARKVAARTVDDAAATYGALLGWYAQPVGASSECAAAHGRNFLVSERPMIGWPGSVHPHCRCTPGSPFLTRVTVDQATARLGWVA